MQLAVLLTINPEWSLLPSLSSHWICSLRWLAGRKWNERESALSNTSGSPSFKLAPAKKSAQIISRQ